MKRPLALSSVSCVGTPSASTDIDNAHNGSTRNGICQPSLYPAGPVVPTVDAGFTLVELLAVIAVIALLAAFAVPLVSKSIESAQRAKCVSNLRSIGAVWGAYAADNGGLYPANRQFYPGEDSKLGQWTQMYGKLHNALRPYVGGNGDIFFCPGYKFSRDPRLFRSDLHGPGAYFQSYSMYAGQEYAALFNTSLRNNLPPAFRVTEARSGVPLIFDETTSSEDGKYSNHFDKAKGRPQGGNALYGDGHVRWRSYDEMIPVMKIGGFIRYY